jgi:hypothetical protein
MARIGILELERDCMSLEVETGKNCKARQLFPDECLERVQELAELLVPAFARSAGEIDVWLALRECALGKMQCFVGEVNGTINAAMITYFCNYPLKRICDVIAYAGNAKDFYWFNAALEDWARDNGAVEMRGYGGESAMRLAKRHGYKEVYRVYKKDLSGKEEL